MSGGTGCLFRDHSCFHERAAQVVVRIDWTRSSLQSSQSLQVMINWCRCHNFTFFQDYTLYIQLENAIPLGHLQAAISRKRKELPEIHWSTEGCCLISFSMYTTRMCRYTIRICTLYTIHIIFGNVSHEIWRIMMPLNQSRDPCLTENRCINAQ